MYFFISAAANLYTSNSGLVASILHRVFREIRPAIVGKNIANMYGLFIAPQGRQDRTMKKHTNRASVDVLTASNKAVRKRIGGILYVCQC